MNWESYSSLLIFESYVSVGYKTLHTNRKFKISGKHCISAPLDTMEHGVGSSSDVFPIPQDFPSWELFHTKDLWTSHTLKNINYSEMCKEALSRFSLSHLKSLKCPFQDWPSKLITVKGTGLGAKYNFPEEHVNMKYKCQFSWTSAA